ncbi:DNA sulfur modification protein DndB [Mycobacteroides chelonae]|uniref:DNA sulfur modification protein DndB n=1 Tax=Mycobacteroides chelonae TaxID=1774 RepID=UPI0039E9CBE1
MTAPTLTFDASRLSGVKRSSTYLATRSQQGGRTVYSIRLPLSDLSVILPMPDPEAPDPDNRRVDLRHARDFGKYILDKSDWVAPSLLARDNGGCAFDEVEGTGGALGYLEIPWSTGALAPLTTIDGQHRVLGVDTELKELTARITKLERELVRAQKKERIEALRGEIAHAKEQLATLERECVGLDIYVEPDSVRARQMFVDVADNAKGISSALRSRFDGSKVANRTLDRIVDHALLKGRVDLEQDRMTSKNPNLMGAKHVADLTRAITVGVAGRIGRKREAELEDAVLIENTHIFLDSLCEAFPDLAAVADGTLAPAELRRSSLLGSVGMLRVLAGVFHEVYDADLENASDVVELFSALDKQMVAPVADDSIWRTTDARADFEPGASAPIMRTQNLQHLVRTVAGWKDQPPTAL